MLTKQRATIEDLYNVPENGKAELVDGKLVKMSPTGYLPNRAAGTIYLSLRIYEQHETGVALTDNIGYTVNLPNRDSFSPDVSWLSGTYDGMKFIVGAPTFAVEVRSENDYGPKAEREIKRKIKDYCAAGTLVVWDVDLQSADVITAYRADDSNNPRIFRRNDTANAEPAVPGWRFPVADLFL
jgi:Uma2 family endonuclease